MIVSIGSASFGTSDPAPLDRLAAAGVEIRRNPHGRRLTEAETLDHVRDADGWIAGSELVTRDILRQCVQLRAVARIGVGLDSVDVAAAEELGIPVSITPDAPTQAVAEVTVANLLALTRRLFEHQRDLSAGHWRRHLGTSLAGLPILIVGYGRIGQKTAQLLRAFGADIRVCDPAVRDAVALDVGLAEAKVVILHASGTETLLGPEQFANMADGTLLLNAARGALVDEDALVDALDRGRIGGAWLDVFREEPYSGPLLGYEQVLVSPHAATFTRQCRLRMELEAVDNLLRDLA